jgi:hypothetical protein
MSFFRGSPFISISHRCVMGFRNCVRFIDERVQWEFVRLSCGIRLKSCRHTYFYCSLVKIINVRIHGYGFYGRDDY